LEAAFPSSKYNTSAKVYNNSAITGLDASGCREVLRRRQPGIEGKCSYCREKKCNPFYICMTCSISFSPFD
jgi:hypothetical protein